MALLTKGTWAVVMDQDRAIILENGGTVDHPALSEVDRIEGDPVIPYSDRPGRVHDVGKEQRSAMELPDLDRIAGEKLAARVVEHLRKVAGARPVVIAAPPQLLGAVRAELNRQGALSGPERVNLVCTLDKTLTGMPATKLPPILQTALDKV
jgi:protein required for attachment to host cells